MRLMVNRISFVITMLICLFSFACGQTQAEKITIHNEYANKATEFSEQGKTEKAIEYQQKALAIFPENADTLAVLAGFYIDLYEESSSKEKLKEAKRL